MQVYSRLNHVGVCVSYTATLSLLDSISKLHTLPLTQWIADDVVFKYCGDNVDKKKGVRDVRSDHQGELLHMYSILAGRSRTPATHLSFSGHVASVSSIPAKDLLPSTDDIQAVRSNLITLVSRVLTQYIDDLMPFAKVVPKHIVHTYSAEMAKKSDVVVVDVLMKNEAKHSDMIDIMTTMHTYLGQDYPSYRRILSGGDQLTCERQVGAQRHTMDGDTLKERLGVLEPVTEDWHCLVCLLGVSKPTTIDMLIRHILSTHYLSLHQHPPSIACLTYISHIGGMESTVSREISSGPWHSELLSQSPEL